MFAPFPINQPRFLFLFWTVCENGPSSSIPVEIFNDEKQVLAELSSTNLTPQQVRARVRFLLFISLVLLVVMRLYIYSTSTPISGDAFLVGKTARAISCFIYTNVYPGTQAGMGRVKDDATSVVVIVACRTFLVERSELLIVLYYFRCVFKATRVHGELSFVTSQA